MKMCEDIGTRCAAASAAACCQPVTPPIFITSGMHRSTDPAAMARCCSGLKIWKITMPPMNRATGTDNQVRTPATINAPAPNSANG